MGTIVVFRGSVIWGLPQITVTPPAGCHRGRHRTRNAGMGCVGSWLTRPHPDSEPDDRSNVRGPPVPSGEGVGSEAIEKENRSNPHQPHSFHQFLSKRPTSTPQFSPVAPQTARPCQDGQKRP